MDCWIRASMMGNIVMREESDMGDESSLRR